MRLRNLLTCVVAFTLLLLSQNTQAQFKTKREYSGFFDSYYYRGPIAFTLGLGPALYHGDYASGFYGNKLGFSVSGGANFKVWPRCVYGLSFRYTTLGSSITDSTGTTSFSGSHFGTDVYGRFYLLDDIVRKSRDRNRYRKNKIYINYGVSYGKGFSFPLGLGYSYDINTRLSVHGNFTHHFMLSDNLDGLKAGGPDGFALINFMVQYSPWGPKPKKKMRGDPVPPNANRQEHQEWRKKKEKPQPTEEEITLPGENTEEQPTEEQPTEEQPEEEQPTEEKPEGE